MLEQNKVFELSIIIIIIIIIIYCIIISNAQCNYQCVMNSQYNYYTIILMKAWG